MIRQEENYNEWDNYFNFWKKYASEKDRIYFHNIFNWGGQLENFKPVSESFEPNLPCISLWSLMVFLLMAMFPYVMLIIIINIQLAMYLKIILKIYGIQKFQI